MAKKSWLNNKDSKIQTREYKMQNYVVDHIQY